MRNFEKSRDIYREIGHSEFAVEANLVWAKTEYDGGSDADSEKLLETHQEWYKQCADFFGEDSTYTMHAG